MKFSTWILNIKSVNLWGLKNDWIINIKFMGIKIMMLVSPCKVTVEFLCIRLFFFWISIIMIILKKAIWINDPIRMNVPYKIDCQMSRPYRLTPRIVTSPTKRNSVKL